MSSELRSVLKLYLDSFLAGKKRYDNIKLQIYFCVSSSTSTRDKDTEMSWILFSLMIKYPRFQGRRPREQGQGFKKKRNLKLSSECSTAKYATLVTPAGKGGTHPDSLPRAVKQAKYLLEVTVPKTTLKGSVKHTNSVSGKASLKYSHWLWCLI